eukprot:356096-Chlamydomonas_euryale.AAC.8
MWPGKADHSGAPPPRADSRSTAQELSATADGGGTVGGLPVLGSAALGPRGQADYFAVAVDEEDGEQRGLLVGLPVSTSGAGTADTATGALGGGAAEAIARVVGTTTTADAAALFRLQAPMHSAAHVTPCAHVWMPHIGGCHTWVDPCAGHGGVHVLTPAGTTLLDVAISQYSGWLPTAAGYPPIQIQVAAVGYDAAQLFRAVGDKEELGHPTPSVLDRLGWPDGPEAACGSGCALPAVKHTLTLARSPAATTFAAHFAISPQPCRHDFCRASTRPVLPGTYRPLWRGCCAPCAVPASA